METILHDLDALQNEMTACGDQRRADAALLEELHHWARLWDAYARGRRDAARLNDIAAKLERLANEYHRQAQQARARRDAAEHEGDEWNADRAHADMHVFGGISSGLLIARELLREEGAWTVQ